MPEIRKLSDGTLPVRVVCKATPSEAPDRNLLPEIDAIVKHCLFLFTLLEIVAVRRCPRCVHRQLQLFLGDSQHC
jgi:hypothetical protein